MNFYLFYCSVILYGSRDSSSTASAGSTGAAPVIPRSRFDNAAEFALMKLDDIVNWARRVSIYTIIYVIYDFITPSLSPPSVSPPSVSLSGFFVAYDVWSCLLCS